MQVGLLGFGRLGKLLAKNLAQDADLYIFDPNSNSTEIQNSGARPSSLEEVCRCQIVIIAVEISKFEQCVKQIKDKLNKDSLVIDVCSVKSYPLELLREHLPQEVEILGTHPMFGPDSAAKTLFGHKIVLCKERISEEKYTNIKSYLERHGLKVIESSPQEHDRQIAHSLLLTHYIGRSLIQFEAKDLEIDSVGYRRLMKILLTVQNDSWQLFLDMNKYNPYAKSVRQKFFNCLEQINNEIK